MKINSKLLNKAKKIKLIAMDVDGVLTDGSITVLNSGEEVKTWNVKDGLAFHLAKRCNKNLEFAWITGRKSVQIDKRSREMGVKHVIQDCMKKGEAIKKLSLKLSLSPDEVAYIGDDLVDIPALRFAGFSSCPSDAQADVKRETFYIASARGGKGVLREVIEIILKARGFWKDATKGYID